MSGIGGDISRRELLRKTVPVGAVAGVAGCSGLPSGQGDNSASEQNTDAEPTDAGGGGCFVTDPGPHPYQLEVSFPSLYDTTGGVETLGGTGDGEQGPQDGDDYIGPIVAPQRTGDDYGEYGVYEMPIRFRLLSPAKVDTVAIDVKHRGDSRPSKPDNPDEEDLPEYGLQPAPGNKTLKNYQIVNRRFKLTQNGLTGGTLSADRDDLKPALDLYAEEGRNPCNSYKTNPQLIPTPELTFTVDFSESDVFEFEQDQHQFTKRVGVMIYSRLWDNSKQFIDQAATAVDAVGKVGGRAARGRNVKLAQASNKATQIYMFSMDGELSYTERQVLKKGVVGLKDKFDKEAEEACTGGAVNWGGLVFDGSEDGAPEFNPTPPSERDGEPVTRAVARQADGQVFQTGRLESYSGPFEVGSTVSVTISIEEESPAADDNIVYGAIGSSDGTVYQLEKMDGAGSGTVTVEATLSPEAAGKDLLWCWIPNTTLSGAREEYKQRAADNTLDPDCPDSRLSLGTVQPAE